jgi:hypothetical protein
MSTARMFFAAMPPPPVRMAIEAAAREHGVLDALGRALFAPGNWHQSLSERIFDPGDALGDRVANLSGRIQQVLRAGGSPGLPRSVLALSLSACLHPLLTRTPP